MPLTAAYVRPGRWSSSNARADGLARVRQVVGEASRRRGGTSSWKERDNNPSSSPKESHKDLSNKYSNLAAFNSTATTKSVGCSGMGELARSKNVSAGDWVRIKGNGKTRPRFIVVAN